MTFRHLPLELYGRFYKWFNFKKIAKDFLPGDFHIRVLCYHDIPEKILPAFEKQIKFLKEEYKIITAEQLMDFFLGRGFLAGTHVFITFDDGSVDQYQAAKILDKHGIQACFFITTGDVGKERISSRPGTPLTPMTWEQIKDLHKRGHIIGSHTLSHPDLSKLQPVEIYQELKGSKDILADKLKTKIDFFAFPYGTHKEISDEAGLIAKKVYDFNFSFISGKNHFASADRHFIKRTAIGPGYSLRHVRSIMSGFKDLVKELV